MGNRSVELSCQEIPESEFLSVFDIEHAGPMTLLTPKKECLPAIIDGWAHGEFDYGRFLRKLLQLHREGVCQKWLRFLDFEGGYADIYLFNDHLFSIFVNRLSWGLKALAFTIAGYCVLRLQLAGKMSEKLAGAEINTLQNGTFFHGDLSASYSLIWENASQITHGAVVFDKDLLKDEFTLEEQIIYRCENNPEVTLAVSPFPVTPHILSVANKILTLDPKQPMPLLQAESGIMDILSQCFVQLHSVGKNYEGLQLRDSDIASLNKVQRRLEEDYAGEITLAKLGQEVGLNRRKLNLGFQLLFGATIGEYLTAKRMSVAQELINEGQTTTVVALEVGYNNRSAFSEAFKRYFGCSPKQYSQRK